MENKKMNKEKKEITEDVTDVVHKAFEVKKETLADKRKVLEYSVTFYYPEKDVKEFIKKIKGRIDKELNINAESIINKEAGKELL